jgi:hypothetical protein
MLSTECEFDIKEYSFQLINIFCLRQKDNIDNVAY